jgi:putative transposase
MVAIIREADRGPVAAVSKRHGISEQTIYTWRKRFGGFQGDDVRRLKKLVAERDLEIKVMKEVAAKNRWACRLVDVKLRAAASEVSRPDLNVAVADPKIKTRFAELGGTSLAGSSGFAKLIADETNKWGKVIRAAKIKPE